MGCTVTLHGTVKTMSSKTPRSKQNLVPFSRLLACQTLTTGPCLEIGESIMAQQRLFSPPLPEPVPIAFDMIAKRIDEKEQRILVRAKVIGVPDLSVIFERSSKRALEEHLLQDQEMVTNIMCTYNRSQFHTEYTLKRSNRPNSRQTEGHGLAWTQMATSKSGYYSYGLAHLNS